ncbi:MAG TPA: transglycosylase domain-containing protein [Euzebyales bacterium]|nr:transglycosylase domain-containing protein [Euzebyales bacterium]
MSQTAPPDRDTSPGDPPAGGNGSGEPPRDWKTSVAAVTATVTSAAVEAVTVVGDAARSLTARVRSADTAVDGETAEIPPAGSAPGAPDSGSDGAGADGGSDGVPDRAGARAALRSGAAARTEALRERLDQRAREREDRAQRRAQEREERARERDGRAREREERAREQRDDLAREREERREPQPVAAGPVGNGAAGNGHAGTWALREGIDTREPAWMPSLRQRPEHERPWLVRAGTLLLATLAGLAAITVAAVALVPRAVALAADSADAELILPEDTEFDPLASRSRVLYADGSLLAILHGEQDRNPVSIDKMPDHVWQAVVAEEDRKFFEHDGYDPQGIARALVANFQAGGVSQGGSTITQQVARMNFEEVGAEESVERKLKEVVYAMALERKFEKNEILDRYLNQVYFGAGAYGVQAASEEFFDTNVRDIEPDQAALLAGLISSPSAYNPRENPERAKQQRDLVLASMARAGFLSESEAADYASRPLKIAKPSKGTNRQPSIVEAVIREFRGNPLFGATQTEREDLLFNGGLRITTTINPRLQKLAERVVEDNFSNDGPTAAIASVNPRNGKIIAAASSKRNNRDNFSLALQGRRQPGSAFKPFVMAEALRQGFSPGTTLPGSSPLTIPLPGEPWTVENYGGASYGPMDMKSATARSVNTYYARLITMVGVDEAVELTEKMGVSAAAYGDAGAFPSLVLGGLGQGTTPVEMASAYGTFANNGVHVEAHLLEEVKRGKDVLLDRKPPKTQVLEPGVNAVALDIMTGPVSSGGTAPMSLPNFPIIGKTGTTQQNTDAWFVGTTPVMSTAVWVGHPEGQVAMYGATGGTRAAPIWQTYMAEALANRDPKDWPEADEAEFIGETVKVPDVTGRSEDEALERLDKAKLVGQVQHQPHATVPAGVVIWASPDDEAQKGTTVYVGVSTGQPPPPPQDSGGGSDDDDDDDDSGDDDSGDSGDGPGNSGGNGNGNGPPDED